MRVVLHVFDGPAKWKCAVHKGGQLSVGRMAGFAVAEDPYLSRQHFELRIEDGRCVVRDLRSNNGTLLNGNRVEEEELRDCDVLRAGSSSFQVIQELDGDLVSAETRRPTESELTRLGAEQRELWRVLNTASEDWYALVDAATGEAARDFVGLCDGPVQSLYEGSRADELARVAPYLVRLRRGSWALQRNIEYGWGKHWGYYFSSAAGFAEARRHLRRLLLTGGENGKARIFRFYDPRVLSKHLASLGAEDAVRFFGPVSQFLVVDEGAGKVSRFVNQDGVRKAEVGLRGR